MGAQGPDGGEQTVTDRLLSGDYRMAGEGSVSGQNYFRGGEIHLVQQVQEALEEQGCQECEKNLNFFVNFY